MSYRLDEERADVTRSLPVERPRLYCVHRPAAPPIDTRDRHRFAASLRPQTPPKGRPNRFLLAVSSRYGGGSRRRFAKLCETWRHANLVDSFSHPSARLSVAVLPIEKLFDNRSFSRRFRSRSRRFRARRFSISFNYDVTKLAMTRVAPRPTGIFAR